MSKNNNMDVASKIILNKRLPECDAFVRLAANAYYEHSWKYTRLYFFFKSELDLAENDYDCKRHLTLYRKGFYDYIAKKQYNSLSEWAFDNGKTLNDILYGVNRDVFEYSHATGKHGMACYRAYVPLVSLLKYLDPSYSGEPVPAVQPAKEELNVFQFNSLLVQIDAIQNTVGNMKQQIEHMKMQII